MSPADAAIALSYDYCRRLTRRAASSFYPCFFLLPAEKRRAMDVLYAFLRVADDLADSPAPAETRRDLLTGLRSDLTAAMKTQTAGGMSGASEAARLLPALADVVARYHIPAEHLMAVIDGVEMDVAARRYETFDDLAEYCHRVASVVGLVCIHIWGFRGPEAIETARRCGLAFQLTNILRDLKEDAATGRIYLPLADLRACGYPVEDLARGVANDGFHRLMALEVDRARRLYHEGAELIEWLAPDGRRIFGMMMSVYHRLLDEIARRPADVFTRRVRLGPLQKAIAAARWVLLPPRRSGLP